MLEELVNSVVRLSVAMTVFAMQEVQSAVGTVDTKDSADKLRDMIDAMANAVSSKIEDGKRPTLDSLNTLGKNVVDRTVGVTIDTLNDTLNVQSLSPKDLVKSGSDAVKSTSDWLVDIIKPVNSSSSEPKVAEEALVAG